METIATATPAVNTNEAHPPCRNSLTTDQAAAVIVAAFGQAVLERLRAFRIQGDSEIASGQVHTD